MTGAGVHVAVVVSAAGTGERFGGPKQFERLAGERLVDRAVRLATTVGDHVVLALPAGVVWDGAPVDVVVAGGATRVASVQAAVAAVPAHCGVVVVHDCIRPLTTAAQIAALVAAVVGGADAAALTHPIADTVKRVRPDGSLEHVGREGLVIAQSPMAFRRDILVRLGTELGVDYVEESIGVERLGGRVVGVAANPWSHHLVAPQDLPFFEAVIAAGLA